MKSALAVNNLSLRIANMMILSDVALTLQPGRITGLVGRSGSGKSMTALALMALAPQQAEIFGEVLLDDENLLQKSEPEWCALRGGRIGMVFQEPMTALNPLQTIGAQVAETIKVHCDVTKPEARMRAEQTLSRVGLSPEIISPSRYPHELSGGQRQRVVIAIAIAMRPQYLICDEPTTALDVTTQAEILDLLRGLAREDNIAILLITHDLAVISQMADNIAVIKKGRIVEEMPASAFFQHDASEDARALNAAPVERSQIQRKPNPDARAIVDAKGIVCAYSQAGRSIFEPNTTFKAVDRVSLSIRQGEIVALVGESGCGKSTLARALLGLHEITEGEIKIDGVPFPSSDAAAIRAARRKIQIVFQDPYSSFNPRLKVRKIIAEPFHLFDRPPSKAQQHERVDEVLRSVGLTSLDAEKYPHEFSGGQRQRIAIARALITNPSVIVLDEATSALDTTARNRVLNLLQSLSDQRGVSLLFITHDLSVVRNIADRTLVMKSGAIVEEGATEHLFSAPEHAYTKKLIAAAPIMKWRQSLSSASEAPQDAVD